MFSTTFPAVGAARITLPLQRFRNDLNFVAATKRHSTSRTQTGVICSYKGDSRRRSGSRSGQKSSAKAVKSLLSKLPPSAVQALAAKYAIPALGLLAAATIIAPIVGALFISSIGFAVAIAAAAAALSLSWALVPLFVFLFGIPMLFGGGLMFAGAASMLIFPAFVPLLLIAGVWLGSSIAKQLFFLKEELEEAEEQFGTRNGNTIDIEVDPTDSWSEQAERELREFDDLLKKRERFKRGGSGGF